MRGNLSINTPGYGRRKQAGPHVFVCHTHTETQFPQSQQSIKPFCPIGLILHLTKMWSRNHLYFCSVSFLLMSLFPSFFLEAVGSLACWLKCTLDRQMGFLLLWETQSYFTWGLIPPPTLYFYSLHLHTSPHSLQGEEQEGTICAEAPCFITVWCPHCGTVLCFKSNWKLNCPHVLCTKV